MTKKIFISILGGIFLIGLLGLGAVVFRMYTSPLGAPLSLQLAGETATPTTQPAVAPTPSNDCNLTGSIKIQVIGRDDQRWEYPFGADVIRHIKLDFDNNKLLMFDFPRDLWINTPAMKEKYALEQSRLGPAYEVAELEERKTKEENEAVRIATNLVAQNLYDNYEVVPDHYITFKESVMADVIDILGGLDVYIPETITSDWFNISVGTQTINGATATDYARYLDQGTSLGDEWGRFQRQEIIFRALRQKLMDPAVLAKVPELFETFKESIITDLTPQQITDYACFLKGLDLQKDITLKRVEREMVNIVGDAMHLKDDSTMNLTKFKQMLKEMFD